jgi:hypothetical protein
MTIPIRYATTSGIRLAALLALCVPRAGVADDAAKPKIEAKKADAAASPREKEFAEKIRPMLERYCFKCHGSEKAKGGLDLSEYKDYESVKQEPEIWTNVLERVRADEMPPKKAGEMPIGRRNALIAWARRLQPRELDCTKLASDRTVNFYQGSVMSRRLNRDEYANTVRDLLGLDVKAGRSLPADGAGGEGFDTTGDTLFTSALNLERYLESAEQAVRAVLPADGDPRSPEQEEARARLLGSPADGGDAPRVAAEALLRRFLRRAFRRPVEDADLKRYLVPFDRAFARGEGYEASIRLALTGVLVSPHFLFLVEPEPERGDIQPLGPFPLASRLSYFLWSTMPDEELLKAAETGELLEPEGYLAQVRRLARDPRASALGERFAVQWLEIDKLGGEARPDATRYPEFDDELAEAMRREVVAYFNHVVAADRPLLELIDSDYTFVDDRLASFYGVEASYSTSSEEEPGGMRRVALAGGERGGVAGMAAVLASTSFPLRTSPVLRGRWILEVLLGEKVPPPPPDIPVLSKDGRDVSTADLREQLRRHRADVNCASCHDKMDPLGFSLESFDNLGRFRESDGGRPVDTSAKMPDGREFSGASGLKTILLSRRDQILRHLTRKLTGYALGRPLNRFDNCVINDAMAALAAHEYRPSALIETIALSKPFRYRYYAESDLAKGGTP